MPTAGRLKYGLILAAVAGSALVLLAWSQEWFVLTLGGDPPTRVPVAGSVAAPALSALALAGLALAGALSIAGIVFRIVLGVLEMLLGACVALSAIVALADPVSAGARAVTELTGVDGEASIAALVSDRSAGLWPVVTLALGVVATLVGLAILLTARRWPASSRRYSAVRFESQGDQGDQGDQGPEAPPDSVADWDSLSDGRDPTSRRSAERD